MRVAAIIGIVCLSWGVLPASAADNPPSASGLLKHLTGTWKAADDRTPRTSELDAQVFGNGAVDLRRVTLTITPTGDADLEIRNSVVGAKGKVFVPSVTEVKMHVGDPVSMTLGYPQPTVSVTSAEDRYLDGDHERFTRDGVRVTISLPSATADALNLQFEPSDGRGGFGATLTPASARRQ